MDRKFWGRLGVLASILAGSGAAGAADLAVKAPVYKAPPPVIISNWAGFYIGFNAGGGWGNNKFDANPGDNVSTSGGVFGGQLGYNWQFGSFVAGVEGDFDGTTISKTDNLGFKQKTDELASARGRIGYVVLPNLLAYGTGGYAYGHTSIDQGVGSVNQNGWAAGGGLEYKLWGPLIARGEYLHYGFGSQSLPAIQDNLKESIDVVRGGLSYKF
jgi:outer membrane immunogenic protein